MDVVVDVLEVRAVRLGLYSRAGHFVRGSGLISSPSSSSSSHHRPAEPPEDIKASAPIHLSSRRTLIRRPRNRIPASPPQPRPYRPPTVASMSSRLFRFPLPSATALRTFGVYSSGGLFALGIWFFLDAAIVSKYANASLIHVRFVDWIPSICSILGMIVINSIEKARLSAESFSFSGSNDAWKARLVLFLGFALMAGGLAGSVCVLVLKYVVPGYEFPTLYFGVANVVANSLIMLSTVVLWVSQNFEDEYNYNLAL